jgi:hypothetical protein
MSKRVINTNVLPGEPLDGTGRVCIHLFVQDERGPFVEPHVLHPALDEYGNRIKQRLVARPTRGRLACDPRRTVAPVTRGSVTTVTPRTDDPRAATCPKCISSRGYKEAMEKLEAAESGGSK